MPFAGCPGASLHHCRTLHNNLTTMVIPTPGHSLVLASRLTYDSMVYQAVALSLFEFLRPSFISSFSPRVLRRPTDSLAPQSMFLRCGCFARPSFFCWHQKKTVIFFVLLSQCFPSRVTALIRDALPMFHPEFRCVALFCGSSLYLVVLAGLLPQVTTYNHCFTIISLHLTPTSSHLSYA